MRNINTNIPHTSHYILHNHKLNIAYPKRKKNCSSSISVKKMEVIHTTYQPINQSMATLGRIKMRRHPVVGYIAFIEAEKKWNIQKAST